MDYQKNFNSDDFDYDALEKSDYVFMRWKEHFLVCNSWITEYELWSLRLGSIIWRPRFCNALILIVSRYLTIK